MHTFEVYQPTDLFYSQSCTAMATIDGRHSPLSSIWDQVADMIPISVPRTPAPQDSFQRHHSTSSLTGMLGCYHPALTPVSFHCLSQQRPNVSGATFTQDHTLQLGVPLFCLLQPGTFPRLLVLSQDLDSCREHSVGSPSRGSVQCFLMSRLRPYALVRNSTETK